MGQRAISVSFMLAGLGCGASACGGPEPDDHAVQSAPLYGGTSVPDASQVGVVWLQHVVNSTDRSGCHAGSGVLLVNDTILTAGHVADRARALAECAKRPGAPVPRFLRISMPDPSAAGGEQVSVLSCAGTAKEGCGARFMAGYQDTVKPLDDEVRSKDVAVIQTGGVGFKVNGLFAFYRRGLSAKPVAEHYDKKVTCYGMSDPLAPGQLRKADFTVLPFPHPLTLEHIPEELRPTYGLLLRSDRLYTVSRGGGTDPQGPNPEDIYDPSLNLWPIAIPGDSGSPCIAHATGVDGDIVGINQSGEEFKPGESPRYGNYIATSDHLRSFVRSRLGIQAGRVFADLDLDGQADDSVEVRVSRPGTIEIVVAFDDGRVELVFDTLIPSFTADYAGTYLGDFNGDGMADVIGTIGQALSALPFYFNGGPPSQFNFTNVPTWQPPAAYQYLVVGRYDHDAIDDVIGVRFNGEQDVFLGEKDVGLTVPAHLVPRGFRLFGAEGSSEQESYALGAPGLSDRSSKPVLTGGSAAGLPGNGVSQEGIVYVLSHDGTDGSSAVSPWMA
jgi:hypothetical protein